jgi:hypothetical protein
MKIAATLFGAATAVVLAFSLAACHSPAASPAASKPSATPAAPHRPAARPSPTPSARTMPPPATAAQQAAMRSWYSGRIVAAAASVCGDVAQLAAADDQVNSGSGSSSLQGDITRLQDDVATALANPPPVRADARIWRRVLNAYSNAAGGPTSSGLVAVSRSAQHAASDWRPSSGPLLACFSTSI